MPYKIKRYLVLQRKPPVTLLDTDSMLFCVEYFCKRVKGQKGILFKYFIDLSLKGVRLFPPSGLVSSLIDANSMAYEACRIMY